MTQAPGIATAPHLSFSVEVARPQPGAAVPSLAFGLRIAAEGGAEVRSVLLRTQLRIQAPQRRYAPDERTRLRELFGWPEQWSSSLQSLFWTTITTVVPGFRDETAVDLVVPVTYDFDVLATKYLRALDDGAVPLEFLFSGTCFHDAGHGLQATQIPWDHEAAFAMPVSVWRETMDAHYPNSAWLRLSADAFERLWALRTDRGFATWDQLVDDLLAGEARR